MKRGSIMYRLLDLNPQLHSFAGDIDLRMFLYRATKGRILAPGQTFGEVLELDAMDAAGAEGGEFIGWTVYEYNIETAEYSETFVEEEGVLCFELFEDYYWVLREYEVCEELISTEELADIICGAPDHLVIANFQ